MDNISESLAHDGRGSFDMTLLQPSPTLSPRPASLRTDGSFSTSVADSIRADLNCKLCNNILRRPTVVPCGHIFCESCLEIHARTDFTCIVCKAHFVDYKLMIRCEVLDKIVNKVENTEDDNSSDRFLFVDGPSQSNNNSLERRESKRCYFTLAQPQFVRGPNSHKKHTPLPLNARPARSSMKVTRSSSSVTVVNSVDGRIDRSQFERRGFGRRSERFTSSTEAQSGFRAQKSGQNMKRATDFTLGDEPKEFKRENFLRRSFNKIRQKKSKKVSTANMSATIHEDSALDVTVYSQDLSQIGKKKKSLWKKIFPVLKIKSSAPKEREKLEISDPLPVTTEQGYDNPSMFALGFYTGTGRRFERHSHGDEITMVIFGHEKSGKSTLVKAIREIFYRASNNFMILNEKDRYTFAGVTAPPTTDGQRPALVSMAVKVDDHCEVFLDIIEAVYEEEIPTTYMKAADAAIVVLDTTRCGSILSALQLSRNFSSARNEEYLSVEMSIIANVREGKHKAITNAGIHQVAKSLKTVSYEMDLARPSPDTVESILLSLCRSVLRRRTAD